MSADAEERYWQDQHDRHGPGALPSDFELHPDRQAELLGHAKGVIVGSGVGAADSLSADLGVVSLLPTDPRRPRR